MKRGVLICLIAFIVLCLSCGSVSAMTGAGTQSNPFKIYNQADLSYLSGDSYAMYGGNGRYFELANNITMSGTFTPIASNKYKFNGHFDGKGYSIIGLKTNSDPTGLFMYVTSGAEIKNINFYNAEITGTGGSGTGVLYGQCYQATSLVTVNNVNVYDSKVTSSSNRVGAITGVVAYQNSQAIITSCHVIGCVITNSSGDGIGAIAGIGAHTNSQATFTSCQVTGCVIVNSNHYAGVGAIAGHGALTNSQTTAQSCNVENCYIYSKTTHVGGIFGYGTYGTGTTCTITNCEVLKSTIRADMSYAGGIYGSYRNNGGQPTVSGCTVTDCTVLASANGGGVTGGYSSS